MNSTPVPVHLTAFMLATAATLSGCSNDTQTNDAPPVPPVSAVPAEDIPMTPPANASNPTPSSPPATESPVTPSLDNGKDDDLPDGWAAVSLTSDSPATTGGADADAGHTYTVTNRTELVQALYPDAVIAEDGTFSSANGPDSTPKIINVRGTISLSSNALGVELTAADYACEGYDFEAYKAAYDPKVWNQQALVNGDPPALPVCPLTTQEALRTCSAARQDRVARIVVGSNTSILGLGADAKIVHGSLIVGQIPGPAASNILPCTEVEAPPAPEPAPAAPPPPSTLPPVTENVIIRNITFEDAFDFFPEWDPADSFNAPPEVANPEGQYPQCQAVYDALTDNGPHQCPGGRWNSSYDNISIFQGARVWVDHCTFSDGEREDWLFPSVWQAPYAGSNFIVIPHDGAVDVTGFSEYVTISYNVFRNHDKVNLIGGSDTVTTRNGWGALNVTLHHNYYQNAGQRLPRVRFGRVHTYSNYITGEVLPEVAPAELPDREGARNPVLYGIGIGYLAKIYSENNVFELTAPPGDPAPDESSVYNLFHRAAPTTGTPLDLNQNTYFFDSGSTLNGATIDIMSHAQAAAAAGTTVRPALISTDSIWTPSENYSYTPTPAADVATVVAAEAGAGKQ